MGRRAHDSWTPERWELNRRRLGDKRKREPEVVAWVERHPEPDGFDDDVYNEAVRRLSKATVPIVHAEANRIEVLTRYLDELSDALRLMNKERPTWLDGRAARTDRRSSAAMTWAIARCRYLASGGADDPLGPAPAERFEPWADDELRRLDEAAAKEAGKKRTIIGGGGLIPGWTGARHLLMQVARHHIERMLPALRSEPMLSTPDGKPYVGRAAADKPVGERWVTLRFGPDSDEKPEA